MVNGVNPAMRLGEMRSVDWPQSPAR